jgi:hypothetical protein
MSDLVFVFAADGTTQTLWTDALDLRAIGTIVEVPRASEVEYEDGWWVVRLPDGTEIARHQNRTEAIRLEVEWLQHNRLEVER